MFAKHCRLINYQRQEKHGTSEAKNHRGGNTLTVTFAVGSLFEFEFELRELAAMTAHRLVGAIL